MDYHSKEYLYLAALLYEHSYGIKKVGKLLEPFGGSAEEYYNATPGGISDQSLEKVRTEIDFLERKDIHVYHYQDEDYPYRLKSINDAPLLVYSKGVMDFSSKRHFVAVVGTREPTDYGRQLCEDFVRDLLTTNPETTIVSGLAFGTDITAHRMTLKEQGSTIIVLAHGLDTLYPSTHRDVAVQSLERGGLVTEYLSGTKPDKANFVLRNRIVAGMCDAVVVVESRIKGGSLITAKVATKESRPLFVFPGRPRDITSEGCNMLIREEGAHLINNAYDFIKDMGWTLPVQPQRVQARLFDEVVEKLTPQEHILFDILKQHEDGIHINNLVQLSQIDYSTVVALLLQMEMTDLVRSLPGGMYRATV